MTQPDAMARLPAFHAAAFAEYQKELAAAPGGAEWTAAHARRIKYYKAMIAALNDSGADEAIAESRRLSAELRGIEEDRIDCGLSRAASQAIKSNDQIPF